MNMTRTRDSHSGTAPRRRTTWRERAIVLGGFAVAALLTPLLFALGEGADPVGAVWLAAVLWTVPSSLALALRRGLVHRDWSAFRDCEPPDGREENFDWDTRSGEYAWMRLAEEHERLMRGD